MKVNGIKQANKLRAGQNLKVVNGPFNAIIYKSRFEMDLYLQNTYVKTYKIGVGQVGRDTPTGKWRVKSNGKLIKPPWPRPQGQGGGLVQPDDPDYPLGSRWIGLDGIDGNAKGRIGFGIHGTKDPKTIGTRSSLGCVRLYNGEAIEVYNMFVPNLTNILIYD
jgi:lipoprotein-anchoring transpeptidase ErfK/SrfK